MNTMEKMRDSRKGKKPMFKMDSGASRGRDSRTGWRVCSQQLNSVCCSVMLSLFKPF